MNFRVGTGYDIHRCAEGRKLFLGGVEIPSERGLLGHSDADALLHAICDALLGAAGLGDIGTHYPDSDPRYKDAASILFLEETGRKLKESGYGIVNIDSFIILEDPVLRPHTPRMREAIAAALRISASAVGVKAKTNEGLGEIGRKEGIAAYAVALISREESR